MSQGNFWLNFYLLVIKGILVGQKSFFACNTFVSSNIFPAVKVAEKPDKFAAETNKIRI